MPSLRLLPMLLALVPALAFAQPPARCDESTLNWATDMHPSALDRCVADPVVACLLEQARGLRFDKPRGGGIVIATYPILWTR